MVHGIEVWAWGESCTEDEIKDYFIVNLDRHKTRIENAILGLEKYTLILNPYLRHKRIAEFALQELKALDVDKPPLPNHVSSNEDVEKLGPAYSKYMRAVEKQSALNMLLVSESAFMAESYLNLIIALFVRSEIRNSRNAMDETLHRRWKTKIERLHIDCLGIKQIDVGNSALKGAKVLFETRIRIAHSYPDKDEMSIGTMWFHSSFPVLEKAENFTNFALALLNQQPSKDEALFCHEASHKLASFLNEHIETEEIRKQFNWFSESNPIGFNHSKNIFGIPFSSEVLISLCMITDTSIHTPDYCI